MTPFVGRDGERACLAGALVRRPTVALVEGEGGVGKTRLVDEVISERARAGDVVLVGRCREGMGFPLAAVVDALQPLKVAPTDDLLTPVAGVVGRLLPELAALLPAPPPPLDDVRAERHRLFRGLVEVLAALGPTVLVVDDLHWADDGSRAFLDYLLGHLPDGLALLCTSRPDALDSSGGMSGDVARLPAGVFRTRVALEPLDEATTATFVAAMLGGQDVSAEFATYLWQRTAGLPFALEEVLRLLVDRDNLVYADGEWVRQELDELGVPAGFAATVHQRIQGLPPDAREVVQAAAVLGVPAEEHVLAQILELPTRRAVDGVVAAISAALLVEVGPHVDFRHALTRQAVYESIAGPQRRRLHLCAAQALEQRQPPPWGLLARHYREAGRPRDWLCCAEAAADAAISSGDDTAAMGFLEDIVGKVDMPPRTRGGAAVKLADAAMQAGQHRRGLDTVLPVLEDPGIPNGQRGELRLRVGRLVERCGDAAGGKAFLRRAVAELRDNPRSLAIALTALTLTNRDATVAEELEWLEEAAHAALGLSDPAILTEILLDRTSVLVSSGDPGARDGLMAVPAEGSTLAEARQLVRGHLNIAINMVTAGRYDEVESHLARGEALGQQLFERFVEPFQGVRLLLRWARGQTDGLEDAARSLLASVFAPAAHEGRLVLGHLLMTGGDVTGGESLLRQVIVDGERAGQFPLSCWARAELAAQRMAVGDVTAGLDLLDEGLALPRDKRMWTLAAELLTPAVRALSATGDEAAAEALLEEAGDGLRGGRAPAVAAALIHADAVLQAFRGDSNEAAAAFAAADAAWSALPRPLQAARARADAGRVRLDAGDGAGEALLRSALSTFCGLGALQEANQVRSRLREHGLPAHARRGRLGYGDALSPREREVARLASEGRTNREIAGTLVVSPRTVDNHMANVLRKLRVGSRSDLRGVCWGDEQ